MTFGKAAAEALVNPEAEETRDEDRHRWLKYLATGAGLAGLGAAGYYGYKNWDKIAPVIDNLAGTHHGGWLKQHAGVDPIGTGVAAGVIGGVAGTPKVHMPWHPYAGASMHGLRDLSSNPGDTAANPRARGVEALNADVRGASPAKAFTLHDEINQAMQPPKPGEQPHWLVDAANVSGGKPLAQLAGGHNAPMWKRVATKAFGSNDLDRVINGLRAPEKPGDIKITPDGGHVQANPLGQLGDKVKANTGMTRDQFGARLEQLKKTPRSSMGFGRRLIGNAIGGGVAGYLGQQMGL